MRAATQSIVDVLDELAFLHLQLPGRGDTLQPGEDAYLYDLGAHARRDDLRHDEQSVLRPPDWTEDMPSPQHRARRRREQMLARISGSLGAAGTPPPLADPDAFAWYQPIHYFGERWGVFVRESGIGEVAERLARFVRTSRDPDLVSRECERTAHACLRLHEAFHHKVESAAIRMEIVSKVERYKPYDDQVFCPLRADNSRDLLEEALANAWMFTQRGTDARGIGSDVLDGLERFLRWWIPSLPGAYSRGVEIAEQGLESFLFRLTDQLDIAKLDPPGRPGHWEVATHLHDPLHNRLSNHYVVVAVGEVPFMPYKELSASPRELGRLLERLGWRRSTGGRHSIHYTKEGLPPIPVPSHPRDISTGTLASIARQAGFDNFRAMLRQADALRR